MDLGPVVIRVEMESLRRQVSLALAKEAINIDEQIKAAIDEFAVEKNLGDLIRKTTRDVMDEQVKTSITNFMRYGAGGEAIKAAVHEKLQASLGAITKEAGGDKGEFL